MRLPTEPFVTADLPRLGLSRHRLQQLIDQAVVRRVFRGVYCPTSLADTIEVRARCAGLVLPPHGVVCDRSAAMIHGIDVLDPTERQQLPALEVVSLRGRNVTKHQAMYAGSRDLIAAEILTVHGVAVTTPVRTALDLACLRGPHAALAALDAFMRAHDLTVADYQQGLRRFRGRRGVVQARRLVPLATALSESPGESYLRSVMLAEGLPRPTPQVWVEVPGIGCCRLDLAYEHLRIAIEYDGREFHGPEHAADDDARRSALHELGWLVVVVRSRDLSVSGRRWWLEELHRAMAERAVRYRRRFPRGEPRTDK